MEQKKNGSIINTLKTDNKGNADLAGPQGRSSRQLGEGRVLCGVQSPSES